MKTVLARRRTALLGESLVRQGSNLPAALQGWLDRLRAARESRRLRKLYVQQKETHAGVSGEALYVRVVQSYLGVGSERAQEIVDMAAESYATWPTPRSVTFRDVAHYLVSMQISERQGWVEGEIRSSVHSRMPSQW